MALRISDLFPFGDADESVVAAAGARIPDLPVAEVGAALGLAKAVLGLLETIPEPLYDAGLSPARWRLLVALVAQTGPDGARIGELAQHLGVREPTVTANVDRAEADGLVVRSTDPADGRIVRVHITKLGMETVQSLLPIVGSRLAKVVHGLGGADATRVLADKLTHAVAEVDQVDGVRA